MTAKGGAILRGDWMLLLDGSVFIGWSKLDLVFDRFNPKTGWVAELRVAMEIRPEDCAVLIALVNGGMRDVTLRPTKSNVALSYELPNSRPGRYELLGQGTQIEDVSGIERGSDFPVMHAVTLYCEGARIKIMAETAEP